jgi:hypothetical protein
VRSCSALRTIRDVIHDFKMQQAALSLDTVCLYVVQKLQPEQLLSCYAADTCADATKAFLRPRAQKRMAVGFRCANDGNLNKDQIAGFIHKRELSTSLQLCPLAVCREMQTYEL